jgi:hypothetical protein
VIFGNDREPRPMNWGHSAVVLLVVLALAIVLMVLVVTADFGEVAPTTVPRTPGNCAPFCPATTDPT